MKCKSCDRSACDSCGHCSCGWTYFPKGWIDVTEKLPDETDIYLVLLADENYQIMFFDGEKWENKFPESVTHWLPLPNPPSEN